MKVCVGIHVHTEPGRLHATLTALHRNTGSPVDVILLPDGPDAEMQAALATRHDLPQLGSHEPLGPPACLNRLIAATDADTLVLLEGGALVGPGWLDYLLAALAADERNGLAGPSTNRSWNEQGVFRQAGGSWAEVVRTAAEARRRFGTTVRTLEPLYSLADFCYAVRREVVEVVGAADESYGLGPCWEMDYNIRAARAGFRGVWACSSYVHRAPVTARRRREEAQRFEASKQRYQDKFCGLRLRAQKTDYQPHCRGDACPNFAPAALIQLRIPLVDTSRQAQTTTPPGSASRPPEPSPPSDASTVSSPSPASEHLPLVSCIMPTYNRRPFVAQAIAYFLRQDYPNRELIIVDDGTDPVGDLVPDDTRIRYLRLPYKSTLGAKRNLSCRQAQGEIIAHWDDDDWMAPWRLTYQVTHLLQAQADLCGLDHLLFYDQASDRSWQYVYPKGSKPWVAGGTLCYTKTLWKDHPFPEINVGEDARFVWSHPTKKMLALEDDTFYVALSMRYVLSLTSLEFWYCQAELHARLHYMDLCPGTMAYRRELWERYGHYPDAPLAWGEDVAFLKALPAPGTRIRRLANEELFVCVRHEHNTWRITQDWHHTRRGWEKSPTPAFLPIDDYQGYVALAHAPTPITAR